jgi:transposase
MPNKLITMKDIRSIISLSQKGFSVRQISREVQLSRNSVATYLERFKASSFTGEELLKMDDAGFSAIAYASARQLQPEPQKQYFVSRIEYFLSELKRTGVTRYLLWEEYKKEYPSGYSYSQFCDLLAQHRKVHEATMHFEHKPAAVMMVDFAGDALSYVDKASGEVITCPVFVAVLPYSGYSFAVALSDSRQPNVIKALNSCLDYFGGVPASVKYDNMKTAVIKSCRYEPVFTDTMVQWSLHNNTALLAARVRKPRDKASVENEVKLVYQRIYAPLRDKVFFNLNELNSHIVEQLKTHHQKSFHKKDYSRLERFINDEKDLLQPLPKEKFVVRHATKAKVQKSYHIVLGEDRHYYSVPFSYIGKTAHVIYDTDTVEIYYDHKRIALHVRSFKPNGFTTLKEHMPESHQRYSEQQGWTPEYFLGQALKIGSYTHLYIQKVLQSKSFTEQTYNACLGIMRLAKSYSPERMEAACRRALAGQRYNYTTLNNILIHHLDTQPSGELSLFPMPEHDNLRGPEAYE